MNGTNRVYKSKIFSWTYMASLKVLIVVHTTRH